MKFPGKHLGYHTVKSPLLNVKESYLDIILIISHWPGTLKLSALLSAG